MKLSRILFLNLMSLLGIYTALVAFYGVCVWGHYSLFGPANNDVRWMVFISAAATGGALIPYWWITSIAMASYRSNIIYFLSAYIVSDFLFVLYVSSRMFDLDTFLSLCAMGVQIVIVHYLVSKRTFAEYFKRQSYEKYPAQEGIS